MKITKVIITAMREEAKLIIDKFNLERITEWKIPANMEIYEADRENIEEETIDRIVLVLAWIGKIQVAIATTYVFENYLVDKLVNIWIAWNLESSDSKIWDVFMPNTFIQHDMYLPFEWSHLDYAKKAIFLENTSWENFDLGKFGLFLNWVCLTWDMFVDADEIKQDLRENFSWDIVEMEAFSILSVARAYDSLDKCVVIKAISDWANNESKDAHMDNLTFAMQNSISILEFVL